MNNRDPIVGDLLEEFRTCILPSRGRVRAVIWVGRQVASVVDVRDYLFYLAKNPWLSEAGIGLAFGALGGVVGGGIEFVVHGRMRVS